MKLTTASKLLLISVLSVILAAMPVVSDAKKVALIVGISDYKNMRDQSDTGSSLPVGDLRGAKNDSIAFMHALMDRYGYENKNIKLLLNIEATKEGVLDAMNNWLIKHVDIGDEVTLYFSGHGTQVLSKGSDPNELWDQAFACYDYAPVSSAANAPAARRNIIIDNDFGKLFDILGKKTDKMIFVADCCYSGTLSRDFVHGSHARWLPPSATDVKLAGKIIEASPMMNDLNDKVTLISACAENEQASEAQMEDNKWHGVFSYYLIKAMYDAEANTSYADLLPILRTKIQANFRQTPQLACLHPEQPIFGGSTEPSQAAPSSALSPFLLKERILKLISNTRTPEPGIAPEICINGTSSEKNSIKIGAKTVFKFRAAKPCYLTLLDLPANGSLSVLYPNKYHQASQQIEADKWYMYPSEEMSFDIFADGPAGRDIVLAIASITPLDISSLGLDISDNEAGSRLFQVYEKNDNHSLTPLGFASAYIVANVAE